MPKNLAQVESFECRRLLSGSGQTEPASHALPSAPTHLKATASGANVTLKWTDTSRDETGFNIYRVSGKSLKLAGAVGRNTTTFSDTKVPAGSATYVVRSVKAGRTSANSTPLAVKVVEPRRTSTESNTPTEKLPTKAGRTDSPAPAASVPAPVTEPHTKTPEFHAEPSAPSVMPNSTTNDTPPTPPPPTSKQSNPETRPASVSTDQPAPPPSTTASSESAVPAPNKDDAAPTPPPQTPAPAPTNAPTVTAAPYIGAVAYSATDIIIHWFGAKNAAGYILQRSVDGQTDWTTIATGDNKFVTYRDKNVPTESRYYYRVVTIGQATSTSVEPATATSQSVLNTPRRIPLG